MKKNIKIAIIIFLMIIISIIIILLILDMTKPKVEDNQQENIDGNSFEVVVNNNITSDISKNEFFNVYQCVQYYIDYINDSNYEAIYKVLDKNYIKNNNITEESLEEEYKNAVVNNSYIAKKMTKREIDTNISIYFVYGELINEKYEKIEDEDFSIVIDNSKSIFSIIPKNLENENNYEYNLNIEDDASDYYNEFIYKDFSEIDVIELYYENYKKFMINNYKEAYNFLDEEYRKVRFGDLEEYKRYIDLNKDKIENSRIKKYKSNDKEDYIEYICIDNYGNYYIFRETETMNYTVISDIYSINIPAIVDKYNDSSDQEKVGMNINKFINAVNQKDYQYVYNKLDETFKQNNYKTQEDLENYLKTQLYDNNSVNFEKFLEQGNNYIYKIKVTNTNDESQSKEMTIVMQLKEGTDFVMSFSI